MKAVYVHVPFCRDICAYCDFTRCRYHAGLADQWLIAVKRELQEKLAQVSVETVYIGGGTPSALNSRQLEQLLKKRLENLDGRRSCMLECRLAEVQLSLAEYDRAEKTLEELTARWPQREAPWMLCLRLAAALRDGEAIQKTLGQIEEKEVYLSARGREIVRFWQGKQQ